MLRFIHCADLHIDRSFEGLSLIADTAKTLPKYNEHVLVNIVDAALAQAVDFVLFAGDTFHQNRPSLKTQHQFFAQMKRLAEADIPVYLIFGNHDYYDETRYWFEFPDNVYTFTSEQVGTFTHQTQRGETYAISGFSYCQPWLTDDKVREFPERAAVNYHLGLYHGDAQSTQYAPFSVREMKQKNYDYWALGHIHVPQYVTDDPRLVYPGTPQGHTRKETSGQHITLVKLTPYEVTHTLLDVAAISWEEITISLRSIRTVQQALNEMLVQISAVTRPRLLKIVLTDSEQMPVNWLDAEAQGELAHYMNQQLDNQWVYQLVTQANDETAKLALAADDVLLETLWQTYEEPQIFQEILRDLFVQPQVQQMFDVTTLQPEILATARQKLANDFTWERKER